jgi:hypothetical protein
MASVSPSNFGDGQEHDQKSLSGMTTKELLMFSGVHDRRFLTARDLYPRMTTKKPLMNQGREGLIPTLNCEKEKDYSCNTP